jgi:lipoprotein-anchoring transpeptidase ErfK/SrfK
MRTGGKTYLQTTEGTWLQHDDQVILIEPPTTQPHWAKPGSTWIDISLKNQTLVAYEGMRPVYATLVSTGADIQADPEQSRKTIEGQFRIHTKHVTATMDSDTPGDEFDLRDVPYVQYFSGNYALHAAFWHDAFGVPKSHGCVNLSPLDARWLFDWTRPRVPSAWHGAMSLLRGTLVNVHQ